MNSAYLFHLGVMFGIQLILVGSFSFLLGGLGVFNLAHVGIAAIGAYASALLTLSFGWPASMAIAAAVPTGILGGLFLSLLLRRVRSDYLALLALQVHLVTIVVLLNWSDVTHGAFGLPGIPRPLNFATLTGYFVLTALMAALVLIVIAIFLRSPYGRVMAAIRDDEDAAACLGKRVPNVRTVAYLCSAAGAALGGALLGHYIQFIDPITFSINMLAPIIAGAVIGGVGSIPGIIIGTAIVTFIPELLRFFAPSPALAAPFRQITFASIILLVLLFQPRGVFGKIDIR